MSKIETIRCASCKQEVCKVELLTDSVTLKCMSFHCDKCNSPCNDVTWIDSIERQKKEREQSFQTLKRINGVRR